MRQKSKIYENILFLDCNSLKNIHSIKIYNSLCIQFNYLKGNIKIALLYIDYFVVNLILKSFN